MNKVTVILEGVSYEVDKNITIEELLNKATNKNNRRIVASTVNNEIKELSYRIEGEEKISFIDLSTDDGIRIYQRSAKFLFIKAAHDLNPDWKLEIAHSANKGLYFEVNGNEKITPEDVKDIYKRMKEIATQDVPFKKVIFQIKEARELFKQQKRKDRLKAIKYREKDYVTLYELGDLKEYFYGYMVPSTGYIKLFDLEYRNRGIILILPKKEDYNFLPHSDVPVKLFNIFSEYKDWIKILGVQDVGDLNEIVVNGKINEFIRISEALQEKKTAQIADMIFSKGLKKKFIMISGPSSSGKTTFSKRLAIQLRVNGLKPVTISLDNYYLNHEDSPLDANGEPDWEALEALDLKLFNEHLNLLAKGEEVEVPIYSFEKGKREAKGQKLKLEDGQVLVMEGIHALNPKLTQGVDEENKFKIYISAITSMRIDKYNRIPTTDTRLVRRIVRDYQFRNCLASETISRWPSVRRGEEKNIFPYQEEADIMFNSSLIYELGALKKLAMPLLNEISQEKKQYSEARRLIEFLSYFCEFESNEIPKNSILKEFLGGSCFE